MGRPGGCAWWFFSFGGIADDPHAKCILTLTAVLTPPLIPCCPQVTPVQCILASNTSSISITRLAAVTSKPHRVVGGWVALGDLPSRALAGSMQAAYVRCTDA